ncbi:MAG: PAS domain S-box protein [Magnetococcus sp. DMHC-1]
MAITLSDGSFVRTLWIPVLGWSLLVVLLLIWNIWQEQDQTREIVHNVGQATLHKDLALHRWATEHGGIYVATDDRTPPNPYLAHLPERDIQTPSGKMLTLMNPAYLLRQLMDENPGHYGIRERITSLNPLNPANAPDPWEKAALEAFGKGHREVQEIVSSREEYRFRLMHPLIVEKRCLQCHGHQGYQVDDIRGGISVAVPMAIYKNWEIATVRMMVLSHTFFWILGLAIIVHLTRRSFQRVQERDEHQKMLQKSETRYRRLMELAGDAIFVADAKTGMIEEANKMAETLLGIPVEKIVGMHQSDLHPRENGVDYAEQFHHAVQSGYKVEDSFIVDGQGDIIPVSIHSGVIDLGDRKIIQGIFRNIRHRKQREQRLREREIHLRSILESAMDSIITIDASGRVTEFNPAAEALFGYARHEIVGKELADFIVPSELRQTHRQAMARLAGNPEWNTVKRKVELPGLRKDGQRIDLELSIIATPWDGKPHYTAFIHDITDRKQLFRSLHDTLDVAESTNRAKSAFLANMSHEIRTPMNAIIGLTDLVLTTQLAPDEQRRNLEIVQQASANLLSLLNEILDLSKIEAGRLTLENVTFDIGQQIEAVCERLAIQVQAKGLEFCLQLADELPATVRGDPLRLQQVITNLVNNAIKFTEEGEIVLRVIPADAVPGSDPKQSGIRLHFSVADTGIGIPGDKLTAIFDHFTQVDESTTRKYGGSGLGLSICKHLVEMMQGDIWIESELGKGSVFHFTVQFDPDPGVGDDRLDVSNITGLRVLLGDGHATNRAILRSMLAGWGIEVDVAVDGVDLLARLDQAGRARQPYDVLLLDHRLLAADETSFAAMPHHPGWRGTSVVMLPSQMSIDAWTHIDWLQNALAIKKPVQRLRMLQMLHQATGRAFVTPESATRKSFKIQRSTLPLHLLLVEDQVHNQKLATMILEQAGHRVTMAADGQEALHLMQETLFDLVLMDLHMPNMGGIEATQRIRRGTTATVGNPRVPIVAVTARTSSGDEKACLDIGMNGFLRKPYRARELLQAIEPFTNRRVPPPANPHPTKKPAILKPVESDPQTLARDVAIFIAETPERLKSLAVYLEKQDATQAEKEIRHLRTTAENVGAIRVVTSAMRLKGNVETLDWETARQIFQTLEDAMQQAIQALVERKEMLP